MRLHSIFIFRVLLLKIRPKTVVAAVSKREYDELSKEMRDRLEKQLEDEQMDKLENYNEERKDKIQQTLLTT